MKPCTTHHHACACREAMFEAIIADHRNEIAELRAALSRHPDKDRLDKLQAIVDDKGTGVTCRDSAYGRGFRLHETGRADAIRGAGSIRLALDRYLSESGWK